MKVDQSVSHDGICLTVTNVDNNIHSITAIYETIIKSNLAQLKIGDKINLERSMQINSRLDGHIVQGHVDQTAICESVEDQDGSWMFTFSHKPDKANPIVNKGSISINGVSLTVVEAINNQFSVAIIPYTYDITNFNAIKKGVLVNIEFDIIGKYVAKLLSERES